MKSWKQRWKTISWNHEYNIEKTISKKLNNPVKPIKLQSMIQEQIQLSKTRNSQQFQ